MPMPYLLKEAGKNLGYLAIVTNVACLGLACDMLGDGHTKEEIRHTFGYDGETNIYDALGWVFVRPGIEAGLLFGD